MGTLHASLLSRDDRVTIRGFADVAEENARTAAQTYGGEPFVDYRSLIDSPRVDAVFVTLPNALRAEPVLYATAAGKHVFSEKPMATTVDEAVRIRDAIEKEMLVYRVGFNKRFAPVYRELRRTVHERGTPTMALAKMNRGELKDPLWVGDPSLTGGYLYETPIHVIDICRYVLDDEVTEVRSLGTAAVYKEERLDNLTAKLTFSRGTLVTLFSCAHATWAFSLLPREDRWGYAAQDRAFVDAIAGEQSLGAYAEDGLEAVRIVAGCYESASTDRAVTLDGQRRTR